MSLFGFGSTFVMMVHPSITERDLNDSSENFYFGTADTNRYVGSISTSQIIGAFLLTAGAKVLQKNYIIWMAYIPMMIAWSLLTMNCQKYIKKYASIVLGMSFGYLEGVLSGYIIQILQPDLRKSLASFSDVFRAFGAFLISGLGLFTTWKTAATVCVILYLLVIFAITLIPETPKLLDPDRKMGRAEKILDIFTGALYGLRGKAKPRDVTKVKGVKIYTIEGENNATRSEVGQNQKTQKDGQPSFVQQIKLLRNPKMFKSLGFAAILLFISNFNGTIASQSHVYTFSWDYTVPMGDSIAALMFNSIGFVASLLCMLTAHRFRVRVIVLCSLAVSTISTVMLFFCDAWIAFFYYSLLVAVTHYGLEGIMWTVLDDMFPEEGRALAFRLVMSLDSCYNSAAISSFIDLRRTVGIKLLFLLYASFNIYGFIIVYFFMPESENIPVEEKVSSDTGKDDDT